jgi:TonB family protein
MEVPDLKPRQQVALKDDNGPGPGRMVANQAESDAVKGNSSRLKIQPGTESGEVDASQGKRGNPGVANLVPSSAVLDKITGAAPNDHLGEVDEGEGTYLNTKEWKYSSFFNRVKQSVGMHWDPGQQLRQRDRTGEIYGGRDRYTVLNVTLNERGMVKDIFVEKSCGLDFLDLEAIGAFERAQPFPNPPPGLMSGDATVRFTFGFYLEMGSSAPRMRLFRQAN